MPSKIDEPLRTLARSQEAADRHGAEMTRTARAMHEAVLKAKEARKALAPYLPYLGPNEALATYCDAYVATTDGLKVYGLVGPEVLVARREAFERKAAEREGGDAAAGAEAPSA